MSNIRTRSKRTAGLLSETALLIQLRKNDPTACKALVDLHGSRVFNTILGMLQNRHDAEDVTQEVFAQAFTAMAGFRGEAKLSTWLYRLAVHKSLEFLRTKRRKKRFSVLFNLFDPQQLSPDDEPPDFQHPGVLLEKKEQAATLFRAIERLPEQQKSAFVLHKVEDLSYAEVAAILDISMSAVESLLFRAKQNLRKLLREYYLQNEL